MVVGNPEKDATGAEQRFTVIYPDTVFVFEPPPLVAINVTA